MMTTTGPSGGLTPAPVRRVPLTRPFDRLARGWRDFLRVPGPGLLHGVVVTAGGWLILMAAWRYWYLMPGAFSGFLPVAPILATGSGAWPGSRRRAGSAPSSCSSCWHWASSDS